MNQKNLAVIMLICGVLPALSSCNKEQEWKPQKSEITFKDALGIKEISYHNNNRGNTGYSLNRDIILYPVPSPKPVIIASPDPEPDPWIN
ncbi:MAG: hypothetical protein ACKOW2_05655 [Sphingobacteriaceae bacterium]